VATLPDPDRAVIDAEKLRDYVLSPDHEHGRHKARVFRSALGIDRDSWEYLREQIASRVVDARSARFVPAGTGCDTQCRC
jgi:hypothetical protein